MESIKFIKAYYIKLGSGGKYENASIGQNKARIGWPELTVDEINSRKWDVLKEKLKDMIQYKSKGSATRDIKALQTFVESTSDDVWITFHASQLWWSRLGDPKVYEDEISRYRLVEGEWHDHDINGNTLLISQIPGTISKVQGFRATLCSVKEVDDLRRLINDIPSEEYKAILQAKESLIKQVKYSLHRLHWKDFETLVDLLFHNAGWRRISVVGETMKYVDMELEEPITGDLYQVQVKSQASVNEFEEYAKDFSHGRFRKFYFVVHSPDEKLATYETSKYSDIELILPEQLARMVVDLGLTDWLLKKIR
jgi:hypothetical protein